MKIRLLPQQLYFILGTVLFLNILMMAGTWLFHYFYYNVIEQVWATGPKTKYLILEFSLATENTLATWYSSMLLLSVAAMSFVCYMMQKQVVSKGNETYIKYGWLMFFLVFSLLSFDELGSIHERLGDIAALNPVGDEPPGWVLLLGLPIGLVAFLMLWFCWKLINYAPLAVVFAVVGILLFASIPIQEYMEMEAWHSASDMDTWKRPVHLLLLEEGAEIFASTFILISTFVYIGYLNSSGKKPSFNPSLNIGFSLHRKKVFFWMIFVGISLVVLMFLIKNSTVFTVEGENGIPRNWFPAATGFLVFLLSLYIFSIEKETSAKNRNSYLLLAVFSLFLSAWYGSNIYDYFRWEIMNWVQISFVSLLFIVALILAFGLIGTTKGGFGKLGIAVWALLICTSLLWNYENSAATAYFAFAFLLLSLVDKILQKSTQPVIGVA